MRLIATTDKFKVGAVAKDLRWRQSCSTSQKGEIHFFSLFAQLDAIVTLTVSSRIVVLRLYQGSRKIQTFLSGDTFGLLDKTI